MNERVPIIKDHGIVRLEGSLGSMHTMHELEQDREILYTFGSGKNVVTLHHSSENRNNYTFLVEPGHIADPVKSYEIEIYTGEKEALLRVYQNWGEEFVNQNHRDYYRAILEDTGATYPSEQDRRELRKIFLDYCQALEAKDIKDD
jgi:hypothetical protein